MAGFLPSNLLAQGDADDFETSAKGMLEGFKQSVSDAGRELHQRASQAQQAVQQAVPTFEMPSLESLTPWAQQQTPVDDSTGAAEVPTTSVQDTTPEPEPPGIPMPSLASLTPWEPEQPTASPNGPQPMPQGEPTGPGYSSLGAQPAGAGAPSPQAPAAGDEVSQAALTAGVDPALFGRLVGQESGGDQGAVSPRGAAGAAQLMPETAQYLARKYGLDTSTRLGNLTAGAYYLKEQLDQFGSVPLALAAYNAGPGAVQEHGGVPLFAETQRYVQRVGGGYEGDGRASSAGGPVEAIQNAGRAVGNVVQGAGEAIGNAVQGAGRALSGLVEAYQGVPYVFGGAGGRTAGLGAATDCSGFVSAWAKSQGVDLPAQTDAAYNQILGGTGRQVSSADARPGDIVFYMGAGTGGAVTHHMGIYAGPGKVLDMSVAGGGGVQERDIGHAGQYVILRDERLSGGQRDPNELASAPPIVASGVAEQTGGDPAAAQRLGVNPYPDKGAGLISRQAMERDDRDTSGIAPTLVGGTSSDGTTVRTDNLVGGSSALDSERGPFDPAGYGQDSTFGAFDPPGYADPPVLGPSQPPADDRGLPGQISDAAGRVARGELGNEIRNRISALGQNINAAAQPTDAEAAARDAVLARTEASGLPAAAKIALQGMQSVDDMVNYLTKLLGAAIYEPIRDTIIKPLLQTIGAEHHINIPVLGEIGTADVVAGAIPGLGALGGGSRAGGVPAGARVQTGLFPSRVLDPSETVIGAPIAAAGQAIADSPVGRGVGRAIDTVRDAATSLTRGLPGGAPVNAIVPPDVARRIPGEVQLPNDPMFREAIANDAGGEITNDGLRLNLLRHQKPGQEGAPANRGGVFYGAKPPGTEGEYAQLAGEAASVVGGTQRVEGETLIRRPLVTRNLESPLDTLAPDLDQQAISREALNIYRAYREGRTDPAPMADLLRRYGGNPNDAADILQHQDWGEAPKAVLENIAATRARAAGYDSIIAVSDQFNDGKPWVVDVHDLRESRYPGATGGYTLRPEFSPDPALAAEADRLETGRQGGTRLTGPAAGIVESDRYYHGTGAAFDTPNPATFDENGLFGPGYYLTSDPRVAGGVVATGIEIDPRLSNPPYRTINHMPGEVLREGYAQSATGSLQAGPQLQRLQRDRAELVAEARSLRSGPLRDQFADADARAAAHDAEIQRIDEQIDTVYRQGGPNVRAVDVPRGLRLLDAEAPAPDDAFNALMDAMPTSAAARDLEMRWSDGMSGSDLQDALVESTGGGLSAANKVLAAAGFDGISYSGGKRIPMKDAAGADIEHNVTVIFLSSLDKITNATSGRSGGLLPSASPVAQRLAGQAAGGAVSGGYAASQEEGADVGSVARGAALGAAGGVVRGAIGRRGMGQAIARAVQGAAEELPPERPPIYGPRGETLRPAAPRETPAAARERILDARGKPITLTTPEEVARLRLDKFPEEVRADLEAAATDVDFGREQRRGVIPDDVANELADTYRQSAERWIREGRAGRSYSEEQTLALRNLASSTALNVHDLTLRIDAARAAGTTPDLLIAQRAAEANKLNGLVQVAEGARAEAGRSLRAWRMESRLLADNPQAAIERIYKKVGDHAEADKIAEEFSKAVRDGADPFALAKIQARVERGEIKTGERFALYRRFNMLSGPRTLEVNATSGLVNMVGEDLAAAGGSLARGDVRGAAVELAAPWLGLQRAARGFAQTFAHGITEEQALRGDVPRNLASRATNKLDKAQLTVQELPDRFNSAVDQFWRGTAESLGLATHAVEQTRGLKGEARTEAIARILSDPDKAAADAAERMANRVTFQGDLGRTGRGLQHVQQIPYVGNLLMPFLRTVYHITSRSLDFSPIGLATTAQELARSAPGISKVGQGAYAAGKELPKGVPELSDRIRDNVAGTLVFAWAYDQARQGNLTGAGPDDAQKRDELRATGWRPYSIKIGDSYHSYANVAPLMVALSSAAAASEAQKYGKPGAEVGDLLADGAARTVKVIGDMSIISGVGAIVKAQQDPERYGTQWLTQFLQTLIPAGSALNTLGQATDTEGERRSLPGSDFGTKVSEGIKSRIPQNPLTPDRGDVPLATNPLGDVVPNQQQGIAALFPTRPSREQDAPLMRTFLDSGVDISRPPKQIPHPQIAGRSIPLTSEEQSAWQQEYGKAIRTLTAARVTGEATATQKRMEMILSDARERAHAATRMKMGTAEVGRRAVGATN